MSSIPADSLRFRRAMAVATRRRAKRRKVPRKPEPTKSRLRYHKFLQSYLGDLDDLIREILLSDLSSLVRAMDAERGRVRRDAIINAVVRAFDQIAVQFASLHPTPQIEAQVGQVALTVNETNRIGHGAQMQALLGVELITPEPGLSEVVDGFVADNVQKIQALGTRQLEQVRSILARGVAGGLRVEQIREQLIAQLGVGRSRASFLARDQTLRLQGELTQFRQENVGIPGYDWDTSRDELVRPMHAVLHGTPQLWTDPPLVAHATRTRPARYAHPGLDYQCRCQAIPRIPDEWYLD